MTTSGLKCCLWAGLIGCLALGAAVPSRGADEEVKCSFAAADASSGIEGPAPAQPSYDQAVANSPPPYSLPPVPNYWNVDECWIGSPLLDRPETPSPGVFFNVETSVLWVHFTNELQGGVAPHSNVGGPPTGGLPVTGDIVRFPGNSFDATVSPRFEIGYRLPDGFGDFRVRYRYIATSGSDTVLVAPPDANDNLGPASEAGRLDINIVDFDYATRQFSLGPDWELRTAVGLRYATGFLESQVVFLNPVAVVGTPFGTAPFTRLSQTESLSSHSLGPHVALELGRKLWDPQLTFFGRLEGAGLYGRTHQRFEERFVEAPGKTQEQAGNGLGTPMLATQFGLSYDVPRWNHARFLVGYQFEAWWNFGRGNNDLSFGTFSDQGIYLRSEFNF